METVKVVRATHGGWYCKRCYCTFGQIPSQLACSHSTEWREHTGAQYTKFYVGVQHGQGKQA